MPKSNEQVFALRIIKTINPDKSVNIRVDHKGENIPMAEVLLIVEGWLEAEKKKMIHPLFGKKG